MSDSPSPAQELQKQVESHIANLASMTDLAAKSERFRAWLSTMRLFHKYSMHNQLLIWAQRPDATRVAGFNTWKQAGRWVNKGERGIAILAPITVKRVVRIDRADEHEEDSGPTTEKVATVRRFRVVHVFDLSQTSGKELPALDYRARTGGDAVLPRLMAVAASLGIDVQRGMLPGTAKGASTDGAIVLRHDLTTAEACGTLAHELAHEILHQGSHRGEDRTKEQMELEAEATSYVVMQHFGIEQASELYLASWAATPAALSASVSAIGRAVRTILSAAEQLDAAGNDKPDMTLPLAA